MEPKKIVQQAREAFNTGRTRDVKFRKNQLKQLKRMYTENKNMFCQALAEDLRKPKQETLVLELNVLLDDIDYQISHIEEWSTTEKVSSSLITLFDNMRIYHDPYGVVLIIGAWNYPLQLPLLPVSGAIAAGNCVIIKPSEVAEATSNMLQKLIPAYLDQDCYKVICGGIPETTELLKERFDYIFYTGSTHVGKIIREAANKYLTPTTLELGGKSPVFMDDTVNMELAARRLLWGKFINAGQTCVAPDYLLCSKAVQVKFLNQAKMVLDEWYGDDPQQSPDLCRIINDRNFNRLKEYFKDGNIAAGGVADAEEKYIAPTILTDVPLDSKVMTDEIFGPILPIVNVESAQEAIDIINGRDPPLSMYLFTQDRKLQKKVTQEVTSGSMCLNDTVIQIALPALPFGGIGTSGMGAYHGKASFDSFTHRKSVLIRNFNPIGEKIGSSRYPPYSQDKIDFLSKMLKDRPLPSWKLISYIGAFGLGALSLFVIQSIVNATKAED